MISCFEDLTAWQKARTWTAAIYVASSEGAFSKDFALRDQIRRSSVSVMSNLAEGFERGHRKEFRQFVLIAKGSCAEARSQLYIALDAGYLSKVDFDALMSQGIEVGRILGGLAKSLSQPVRSLVARRSSLST
jgi:four helix bundle protein